jgi:hypothetical protein
MEVMHMIIDTIAHLIKELMTALCALGLLCVAWAMKPEDVK